MDKSDVITQTDARMIKVIKVLSILLISTALSLNLWYFIPDVLPWQIPNRLYPILLGSRVILFAHVIEGLIAAVQAPSRGIRPLTYGLYTFWVGFVGISELFRMSSQDSSPME